jgi:hypothetical protein
MTLQYTVYKVRGIPPLFSKPEKPQKRACGRLYKLPGKIKTFLELATVDQDCFLCLTNINRFCYVVYNSSKFNGFNNSTL